MGSINITYAQNGSGSNGDFNRWQVRLRGIAVTPDEGASIDVIGGEVDISTAFVPEVDITCFLPKTGLLS